MKNYLGVVVKEIRFRILLFFVIIVFTLVNPLYSSNFASLSPLTIASSPADGLARLSQESGFTLPVTWVMI
jgi:hypothetical protein